MTTTTNIPGVPSTEGGAANQNTANPVEKLMLNSREVCAALGISKVTLWRLTKRGLLKPHASLRHKLYPVAAVRRFVQEGGFAA